MRTHFLTAPEIQADIAAADSGDAEAIARIERYDEHALALYLLILLAAA